MGTLIVDIETHAPAWKDLPGVTRSALTGWIERGDFSPEEKQRKSHAVQSKLALSPFTASIISLAVYDLERATGAVYYVAQEAAETEVYDGFTYKPRTETEILEEFWEGATSYDVFVTFNGRSFTLPFLYHRSMACRVRPTVDIAQQRYLTRQSVPYHVDLLEEFSFHGSMTHRPSLQLLCGAYRIENQSLLGGEEIAEAYREQRFRTIAEKNAGDVQAITGLFEIWKTYLAPRSFLNALEG
jgi:hypothetical protein